MCEERGQIGATLESTLKQKDDMIQNMKAEVVQIRLQGERAYREREDELLRKLQEKTEKEICFTQESEKHQKQQCELQEQTQSAQRIIDDLNRKINVLHQELEKKEQARQRWEDEVKRIESSSNCASIQLSDLQKDYNRIRQQ